MNTNQQTAVLKGSEQQHTTKRSAALVSAPSLIRSAGLAAVATGILFILIQLIHPTDVLSSVHTARWTTVHCLGIAMCLLGLLGITGIYARQVKETGWLGLAGYILLGLFYTLTMSYQFIEAFVLPPLVAEAPQFTQGFLGIAGGTVGAMDVGALESIYMATGGLYLLGGLMLGIATFRAGILSRGASGLLALGTILPLLLSSLVHHPYDRLLAVPVGVSLAWLGYSLWTERRENAR
ncbi:hypothetical protein [Paenibacillus koleovorans]|uniref:hypothetical protein n=1 Tax=Paenibacillus koleovorans TaxID=121608 RepID=UPI001FEB485D|nr:hypothetical protein [Paenibacillus koleovorans]